jgi:hypothetical protein
VAADTDHALVNAFHQIGLKVACGFGADLNEPTDEDLARAGSIAEDITASNS